MCVSWVHMFAGLLVDFLLLLFAQITTTRTKRNCGCRRVRRKDRVCLGATTKVFIYIFQVYLSRKEQPLTFLNNSGKNRHHHPARTTHEHCTHIFKTISPPRSHTKQEHFFSLTSKKRVKSTKEKFHHLFFILIQFFLSFESFFCKNCVKNYPFERWEQEMEREKISVQFTYDA